jgi:hypothetical protein
MASEAPCVGCGGRNPPDVPECLWCGRAFRPVARPPVAAQWLMVGAALAAALGVLLVVVWGVLASQALIADTAPAAPSATPAPRSTTPPPPELVEAVPEAEPPPAAAAEFVRVANTGGQGISLRREPHSNAPRVTARPENTVLEVVGPDEVSEGRVWRQVQDAQGNRGWAPADFLVPAPPPS